MRLSGYVNTNYLFSLTEEDADEEQQKFYRFRQRPRLSFYLNILLAPLGALAGLEF